MDALLLSRIRFAWLIAFHILLPAFTVGLACYVATLEIRYWITKDDTIRRLSAFWIKIFAISFGMGVVSGIVMPFQFGTNWSRFSDSVSTVIGLMLAYEVLTASILKLHFSVCFWSEESWFQNRHMPCPPCWLPWARCCHPSGFYPSPAGYRHRPDMKSSMAASSQPACSR